MPSDNEYAHLPSYIILDNAFIKHHLQVWSVRLTKNYDKNLGPKKICFWNWCKICYKQKEEFENHSYSETQVKYLIHSFIPNDMQELLKKYANSS